MREEESKISHQFDVWHFVKNIKKRLHHKVGKNKLCEHLQKWTKSMSNHWWAVQLAKGAKNCCVKNGSASYFMFKIV